MKQDNNTTREKSIEWWSNLHYEKAHQLRTQYFPGAMLISHTDIEHIYLSEHPEQPIKEDTLTKDEAIEAMLKGYKVTHQYFTDSEWAKLNGHFEIEFEDGCKIKVDDFWRDRKGEEWQMGWSIFAEPIKEQSSNREEKLKTELECMYSLNREGWNKVEFYEKENTRLKERIEVLERAFYMDICRAYNAGKQNALEMVAEGKRNGESLEAFKSSHEYFIGEFPTFKTNVP